MITVEEAIQSVQSLYNKGIRSKDTRLSYRHTYSALLTARTLVLKQQLNKRQKVNDECFQDLPCIELEKALVHECPCVPNDKLFVLRSKEELPTIVSNLDGLIIQYVSSLDGATRYDMTTFENVKYMSGNKFTGNKPKYYIKNNRIYIIHSTLLKGIAASILAEDPIQAALFPSVCGDCIECNCKDYTEFSFHTDRDTFSSVEKIAAEKLIIFFSQMREDINSNANDDSETVGKMIHR